MKTLVVACCLALALNVVLAAAPSSAHYPATYTPLTHTKFVALPLGAVKPAGWLRDQLVVVGKGLTGHLDEFWPSVSRSAWKGGPGDAWERGPYYLDGLVPLAYLLEDQRLIAKAQAFIDFILESGQPSGWFGPAKNRDRWPLAVAMKALTQYQEATGDKRVIPLLTNYFTYLATHPPDWPDKEWRGVRAKENIVTAYWLYNRNGNPAVLKAVDSILASSFNWTTFFQAFPYTTEALEQGLKYCHQTHVVNLAMAIKCPALRYVRSGDESHRQTVYTAIRSLDEYHGQVGGRFSGDEHLSGRRPTQGTELCGVVEYMFTLENLLEILGDPAFGDRLELLAYNANPGACTADYWAHQYDQQANQVLCTVAKRAWSTNSDSSNIYGLEPHYGCCTANMHQGWPKFVSHLWMATRDRGLAAVAYGPCAVKATVGAGETVTITEDTDYPFEGTLRFVVKTEKPISFPLYLRIPAWAEGATLSVGATQYPAQAGTFAVVERTWQAGDTALLVIPMTVRIERRYNNAVSLLRGPIVFSLPIRERRKQIASHHPELPAADWEIYPMSSWNYALVLDPDDPGRSVTVIQRRIGAVPFATEAAPVTLRLKGRVLPDWQLAGNSAGETPESPVKAVAPAIDVELVPYGSTRLRMTEFPVSER